MSTGMLLGKFMPPHLGHVYLGEFAARFVDELTIVVGTLNREPIPGILRFQWMKELFPFCNVVHLTEELPQEPSEHPDFWEIWRTTLLRLLPYQPDYVFASETYGWRLAQELKATLIPVDCSRSSIPVSGTAIRTDPLKHWDYLPRCVRPYFVKRICIFGPESTGKTTLARQLAQHFRTVWVPEYARTLLEASGGEVALDEMEKVARGQAASEDALARNASRLLITDTDPLATQIWSEVLFGTVSPIVRTLADTRAADLYLLLSPDVPWVADPIRYLPDGGIAFFERCRSELVSRNRNFVIIQGNWDVRFRTAVAAIEHLMIC